MKKIYKLLLITAALVCVLATSVFASEYDKTAQELKDIGLFQGTTAGFDLDSAPTRAQAAVMLVRLLGAENQAKADYSVGRIANPFTDVPDWAAPHIAWLYKNNLAKGVSGTVFGANGQCTDKMFCTFVLRALGYSDANGDFSFDTADVFAESTGVYDSGLVEDTFLRDHAVAISYQALATCMKGTSTTLLEKLIKDGAVTESGAASLLSKVKTYRSYLTAYDKMNAINAMDMTINQSIKMLSDQTKANVIIDSQTAAKVILSNNNLQMEIISTTNNEGNTINTGIWIKDGYMYMKSGSFKIKTAFDMSMLSDVMAESSSGVPEIALYDISSVTSSSVNGGTQYTFTYSDSYNVLNDLDANYDTLDTANLSVGSCTLKILVGSDGLVKSFNEDFVCTFTSGTENGAEKVNCTYSMNGTINATGNGVVISFPDFTGYIEK